MKLTNLLTEASKTQLQKLQELDTENYENFIVYRNRVHTINRTPIGGVFMIEDVELNTKQNVNIGTFRI